MDTREVAPGLWYWTAPHPSWRPGADWPEHVNCVYYEAADAVVLIDPLLPRGAEEDFLEQLDRDVERVGLPVTILLTAPWHERDAPELAERYGTSVGHSLPEGVELFVPGGQDEGQVAFFIRPHRALVVAEFLMGHEGGLRVCPSPALVDKQAFDTSLRELLELPIDRVLVAHGEPVLAEGRHRITEAVFRSQ